MKSSSPYPQVPFERILREDEKIVNVADVLSSALSPDAEHFEQITIDATVGGKGLTAASYGTATKATITVEAAQIRFRIDGGAPTATIGHLADDGDQLDLESADDIANFKAIRTGSTSAVISATYSK